MSPRVLEADQRCLKASNYDYAAALEPFVGPVECLAYDPRHRRIAMAGDGCLKVFSMDGACVWACLVAVYHACSPFRDQTRFH